MGLYRKILVAFDGSESGSNALLQSFRLANEEKCWITVLTVVPTYDGDISLIGIANIHDALRRPGEEILARATETAKREGALIKTVLAEGDPYERIVELAESENFGIIVMGRRGMTAFERALMGNTTARAIGHTTKDVLVVPKGASVGWNNIVVATDGSRYSEAAISKAIAFAQSYGGSITVVSVVDVQPEYYAEAQNAVETLIINAKSFVAAARDKAAAAGLPVETYVGEGNANEVIAKLAAEKNADVIIMGSHGRTGIKRLLMGSVTEKVIGSVACPVLVTRG